MPPALSSAALSQSIEETMWSISRSMLGTVRESLKDRRLSPPQFWILRMVEANDSISTGEVSQNLCVRSPTATGLLDHLVARGYVERRVAPADRRKVLLALTPRGTALLRSVEADLRSAWGRTLSAVPSPRRQEMLRTLRELARYLGATGTRPMDPPAARPSTARRPGRVAPGVAA